MSWQISKLQIIPSFLNLARGSMDMTFKCFCDARFREKAYLLEHLQKQHEMMLINTESMLFQIDEDEVRLSVTKTMCCKVNFKANSFQNQNALKENFSNEVREMKMHEQKTKNIAKRNRRSKAEMRLDQKRKIDQEIRDTQLLIKSIFQGKQIDQNNYLDIKGRLIRKRSLKVGGRAWHLKNKGDALNKTCEKDIEGEFWSLKNVLMRRVQSKIQPSSIFENHQQEDKTQAADNVKSTDHSYLLKTTALNHSTIASESSTLSKTTKTTKTTNLLHFQSQSKQYNHQDDSENENMYVEFTRTALSNMIERYLINSSFKEEDQSLNSFRLQNEKHNQTLIEKRKKCIMILFNFILLSEKWYTKSNNEVEEEVPLMLVDFLNYFFCKAVPMLRDNAELRNALACKQCDLLGDDKLMTEELNKFLKWVNQEEYFEKELISAKLCWMEFGRDCVIKKQN